jgi:hypothetical protein
MLGTAKASFKMKTRTQMEIFVMVVVVEVEIGISTPQEVLGNWWCSMRQNVREAIHWFVSRQG